MTTKKSMTRKHFLATLFTALLVSGALLPLASRAVNPLEALGTVGASAQYATATENSATQLVATFIKGFLSVLGIVFLGFLVYGGFVWMKAQGSEEEVKRAKSVIEQAIIGLAIVIGAYAVTFFVTRKLEQAALQGG